MAEAPNTRQPCTIVTGSSRGIGRAIATGLAKDGHRLVLTARDAALLDEVANELRAAGTEATTVVADLRSPNAVAKVLAAAEAAFAAETAEERAIFTGYPRLRPEKMITAFARKLPQLVANALVDGRVLVTEGGLPTTDVRDLAEIVRAVFEGRAESDRVMGPAFFLFHLRYHSLLESITGRDLAAQRLPGCMLRILGRFGGLAFGVGGHVCHATCATTCARILKLDDSSVSRSWVP